MVTVPDWVHGARYSAFLTALEELILLSYYLIILFMAPGFTPVIPSADIRISLFGSGSIAGNMSGSLLNPQIFGAQL